MVTTAPPETEPPTPAATTLPEDMGGGDNGDGGRGENRYRTRRPKARLKKKRIQRRGRARIKNRKLLMNRRRINYVNMIQRRQTRLQALMRMYFWRNPIQLMPQPLVFPISI